MTNKFLTAQFEVPAHITEKDLERLLKQAIEHDYTGDLQGAVKEVIVVPDQEWTTDLIIMYALMINQVDESGDGTMLAFVTEDPSNIELPFGQFCERFLEFAQGANWKDLQTAIEWYDAEVSN